MKVFLYICAGILLIGPLLAWTWISAMACAFVNSSSCGVDIGDFINPEFLTLYALPFLLGIVCFYFARKRKSAGKEELQSD
jgi:hypothetical protein